LYSRLFLPPPSTPLARSSSTESRELMPGTFQVLTMRVCATRSCSTPRFVPVIFAIHSFGRCSTGPPGMSP
jgi:hypothetical protein